MLLGLYLFHTILIFDLFQLSSIQPVIFCSSKMSIIVESFFFILLASLLLCCSWRRKEKVYQKNLRLKWES